MGERADFVKSTHAPGDAAVVGRSGSDASDPEIIAGEIEQTRGEMSATIGAISQRLDPDRISEQAVSAATEVTQQAREAAGEVAEQAREVAKEVTEQAVTAATEVTEQARDAAKDVAQFAIEEAKTAVNELAAQAKASVREATIGKVEHMAAYSRDTATSVKGDLLSTIKQNPVPAALAAIGIGWLWTHRSGGSQGSSSASYGCVGSSDWSSRSMNRDGAYGSESGWDGPSGGNARQMGGQVLDQAQQMKGQVADQAQERAGQMQDMAGQVVGQFQERAGQLPHQMQEKAGQVQHQAQGFWHMVEANPVAVGALGTVLGGVAGLMLPATERENQLMGESRNRVLGNVQEVAGETIAKVQLVAEEAGKSAMEAGQAAMEEVNSQQGSTKQSGNQSNQKNGSGSGASSSM